MSRRQSLDKPAILSPPVQFIVPSPTASASPSPRLLHNASPNQAAVVLTQQQHHHLQQSPVQHVLVTNTTNHHHAHDISARRLSTGSNPSTTGGTILLRQSPSQSPSHNIIFTNGPVSTTPSPQPTGHEFNTTLVGSNNIALNVKRTSGSGATTAIFGGPNAAAQGTINSGGGGSVSGSRRHSTNGGGGASPKPGKRSAVVTMTQSSPVPSPMASPTLKHSTTPSPIHHQQIPILTGQPPQQQQHHLTQQQPLYQLIQTSSGAQQLIPTLTATTATAAVHQQQQQQQQLQRQTITFNAPQQLQQQQQQVKAHKGPQQILPKPATGIGTAAGNVSNSASQAAGSSIKGPSVVTSTVATAATKVVGTSSSNGVPISSSTIFASSTNPQVAAAPAGTNPILLPTAQPHQLIMSAGQMPMLVQQNTPQGVQFILRQPTGHHQLAAAPLVLGGTAAAATARGPAGQPQQLLRIVNGNGQVQFSPATTTFIMSSQGNLIQQLQAAPTTTQATQQQQQQQQHQIKTEIQQKLSHPIQFQGQTLNPGLVQMSTGHQFIQQFPAQNFNFANVMTTTAATVSGEQQQVVTTSGQQQIHAFGGVQMPQGPIQIISPIASPALATQQPQSQQPAQQLTQEGQMVIVQQAVQQQGKKVVQVNAAAAPPPPPPQPSQPQPVKPKKEKKEPKKGKSGSAVVVAAAVKKSPVAVTPSPTPPPPAAAPAPVAEAAPKGKLDLANVMMLCGIGLDDGDEDDEFEGDYQAPPPPPPPPSQGEEEVQEATNQAMQEEEEGEMASATAAAAEKSIQGGEFMITIPGMNHSESIPISFSIPASVATGGAVGGQQQQQQTTTAAADEVISMDVSWSPQKMNSGLASKLIDDNMCVDTFVNSVLDSHVTPTLQSQIAEIQNQLMGVTSEVAATTSPPKSNLTTVEPTTPPVVSVATTTPTTATAGKAMVSPAKKVSPPSTTAKTKVSKKANGGGSQAATVMAPLSVKKTNVTAKNAKDSPKAQVVLPTKAPQLTPMTMPSQIGNIQISQVDTSSAKGGTVQSKVENQIQITPILDKPVASGGPVMVTTANGMFGAVQPVIGAAQGNMTVTMKTVAVNSSNSNNPPPAVVQAKPQPAIVTARPQPATVIPHLIQPSVQINLQAAAQAAAAQPPPPPPPPSLALAMQQQQHPLLAQLTGALSLNLMDDGRLVLKHDVNAPQDAQSQMILQTILSGALPSLTLVNETKTPPAAVVQQQPAPPPVIVTESGNKPPPNVIVPSKVVQAPVQQVRKAIVEPQPHAQVMQQQQQQQQPPPMLVTANGQGTIVELPKIGPDKQLFKMNMATNQITQISAGAVTALVGPTEQLLIVPADINPQQLAQCQAAGQLQLHNMGQLKATQGNAAPQAQPQVTMKPQPVMPALAPVKNPVVTTTTPAASVNKRGKKTTTAVAGNGGAGKETKGTARVAPSQVKVQQQQQQPAVPGRVAPKQQPQQQQANATPPIIKNHVIVPKGGGGGGGGNVVKVEGNAVNTAVVRPNTFQSHQVAVKPLVQGTNQNNNNNGNKMIITGTPTPIMQNLQKNTQIVLPSTQQPQQPQPPQPQQNAPRVQTIQLTLQNQQMLMEVQKKCHILFGKLKDKKFLDTLTQPLDAEESTAMSRQPLPTIQECHTMSEKDIHVALQRLFMEQQRILASGTVIPMIPNLATPPGQGAGVAVGQSQQPQVSQGPGQNVMQVQPTVNSSSNKIQLPGSSSSSGGGGGGAAEMVKNWPLMKTQQINEMTIKPIIATSSSGATPSFPVPSKVINSTTIIPTTVSGTMNNVMTGGGSASSAGGMTVTAPSGQMKMMVSESGTMSITPVVVPVTAVTQAMQQQQKVQLQVTGVGGQNNKAVIGGAVGGKVAMKPQLVMATGGGTGTTLIKEQAATVLKVEQQKVTVKVEEKAVKVKVEKVEGETGKQQQQLEMGKSAQELAEITKRIENRLKYDQECCTKPDTDTPFRGKDDAVMRLFGYHCNYREFEPEFPEEEVKFQEAAVAVQEGLWSLKQRFQGLLMTGSMLHVATSERVMMERILKTELEQEIVDIKAEIERLKNPSPPPLVQIQDDPPVEFFKPIATAAVSQSSLSSCAFPAAPVPLPAQPQILEDDTTRTSEATDSRSLCDVKSESGQFGWNDDGDWSEDEEDEAVVGRLPQVAPHPVAPTISENCSMQPMAMKKEEQVAMTMEGGQKEDDRKVKSQLPSSGFDIESEILPNFILNMKKNGSGGGAGIVDQMPIKREAAAAPKEQRLLSPVSPVKSEGGYDEWTSIQRELASMDPSIDNAQSHHQQQQQLSLGDKNHQASAPLVGEKHRFYDFEKAKKPWSVQEEMQESGGGPNNTIGRMMGMATGAGHLQQQQQQQQQPSVKQSHGGNFFSLETSNHSESESWLDFQHNNNSFDFPIGVGVSSLSHGGLNGTAQNASGSSVGNHQSGSQKRPWNGFTSNESNGASGGGMLNGGGGDEFYAKKMCYGNGGGDFDFQHLIMGGGGGGGQQQNQQQSLQSQFGNNGGGGIGGNGVMSGGIVLEQSSHSQNNFDEDINRQMQSAIDSILNLQGTDAADFHFNLDPAMGALLDSSSGHGAVGGGDTGGYHHNPQSVDEMSNRLSTNSPSLMRFGIGGGGQTMGGHHGQMNNYNMHHQQQPTHHHHHHHQQQHQSLVSSMILSDDDDEDEQQRAIKSVLLS